MTCVRHLAQRPDLIGLAGSDPSFFPVLLASEAANPTTGCYSILGAAACETLVAETPGQVRQLLRRLGQRGRAGVCSGAGQVHSPFIHGWFFYLAYEAIAAWEPRLAHLRPPRGEPLAMAFRCNGAVVVDHQRNTAMVVAVDSDTAEEIRNRVESARISAVVGQLQLQFEEEPAERFVRQVQAVQDYIAAGDVYQVNLSRRWFLEADDPPSAASLYRQLALSNPAPFAGLLQWRDFAVISSSPERLVRVRGTRAETRPIAGTRPRSHDDRTDAVLMKELIAHPKERAEHIMLLDLERNDLGKICRAGSVMVDELMVVESYAHVHHIVSNVCGQLNKNVKPCDVLQAVFPGGTITGCPKLRCMQIIEELEQRPRGAYTGGMGYVNHDGAMDCNILIRSLVRNGRELSFMAGAGIVMDSVAWREVEETGHKAKGLLRSLVSDKGAKSD